MIPRVNIQDSISKVYVHEGIENTDYTYKKYSETVKSIISYAMFNTIPVIHKSFKYKKCILEHILKCLEYETKTIYGFDITTRVYSKYQIENRKDDTAVVFFGNEDIPYDIGHHVTYVTRFLPQWCDHVIDNLLYSVTYNEPATNHRKLITNFEEISLYKEEK